MDKIQKEINRRRRSLAHAEATGNVAKRRRDFGTKQTRPNSDVSHLPQSEVFQPDPTNACGGLHPPQGRPRIEA
jgi:hypothetical protein